MRASVASEKAGVPAVSIVETGFMRQALGIAKAFGVENPPIAEYPGQIATDSKTDFEYKMRNKVVPEIVSGLATPVRSTRKANEPAPRDIIFTGTWEEVDEHFYGQLWTDGLPIVPPTIEKVEQFLRFTDRSPDEVLGVLLPERREATVWNVAVNGVMAGCRPEYMPILIAAVECVADPEFRIEDAGSTPGWEPLVIVNGPLVKQFDFNTEVGAMRAGKKANTSIGRFLNMYFRNVAGLRPGLNSKGTIGANFNVALAENEDAAAEFGWEPFSVDSRGFQSGQNVVTVQSVVAVTGPTYSSGDQAAGHLDRLAEYIGSSTSVLWSMRHSFTWGQWHCLFVISPRIARVIAKDFSKREARQYLWDHCRVSASVIENWANDSVATGLGSDQRWTLRKDVEKGTIPADYAESDDPNRLVRTLMNPDWIEIVVAGDPARNQARGYMNNHEQGVPVSRAVRLPARWEQLLKESGR